MKRRRHLLALSVFALAGCPRGPAVLTTSTLPLRRVVVYRNGVGYFERSGRVEEDGVEFRVLQSEVGDFLATLAVMEQGGSSVRSAAFPMPDDANATPENANARRAVRLELDGRGHDLVVGYTVETPIWRPSYRLVFTPQGAQVQAWGIVQNVSGEDWSNVRLSLVAGTPVSFRSELAEAVVPARPLVTDRGSVIDNVPQGDTTLAQSQQPPPPPPSAALAPAEPEAMDEDGDAAGAVGGEVQTRGAGRRSRAANAPPARPMPSGQRPGMAGRFAAPAGATAAMAGPSAPRSVASLAAVAVQGGASRYDLPNLVTVPNHSATMVMLVVRDVPGQQMYLFAPDPGVADSASHPFHVARFENRTGGMLERGPLAIFERGAFLGEGVLDPLPDGATATVPFALERGVAVESSATSTVEGARLLRIVHEAVTVERYQTTRTTYRARNGMDENVRVMARHALAPEAQLFNPPAGTEQANGAALVPIPVAGRSHQEVEVTTRVPFAISVDWGNEQAAEAIRNYIRDGHPAPALAATLQTALDLRRQVEDLSRERDGHEQRRQDLQRNAEETRNNLQAVRRIPTAADLRAQLTARLARTATELDQITRRIVELDTQLGERRVRLAEAVRSIEVDVSSTPAPTSGP